MWRRFLVLGGIRSGKSEYAEALVAEAPAVRYVATARPIPGDAEWATRIDTHRIRRPPHWTTEEVGADPAALVALLREARADDTLLVEELGTWVAAMQDATLSVAALGPAVADCAARLVLVSPEVGLTLVPASAPVRAYVDALGATNQAVAAACDRVVLVIAGCAVPVKGGL
jgi:adenosyl cobinamide kinase/adenosyl cobinamide phosphate guanylyltransferase